MTFGENSVLLEIRGPGTTDPRGSGDSTNDGSLLWTGRVPATIQRRRAMAGYEPQGSIRTGGGGRTDVVTVTDQDVLIVRTQTGVLTSVVTGGRTNGYTVLVEDRRDRTNITQTVYRVHGASLRAGDTPGQSLMLELGDG